MLKQTFVHIPGIGQATEQRLWREGLLSWDEYLSNRERLFLSERLQLQLDRFLPDSRDSLARNDARYFERLLPHRELWRIYPEFNHSVAFLDIETTGLFAGIDEITVIGLFDGDKTKVFVKGINLEEFYEELRRYAIVVTYNGKRFDLPFIRTEFGNLEYEPAHIDLRYILKRLGYSGGLKSIERQLGLQRQGDIGQLDGYMAILLWEEYQRGNRGALDTLIRYNLEDVVSLQWLMELAYNEVIATLPIPAKSLRIHHRPDVDMPFDSNLIKRLVRSVY